MSDIIIITLPILCWTDCVCFMSRGLPAYLADFIRYLERGVLSYCKNMRELIDPLPMSRQTSAHCLHAQHPSSTSHLSWVTMWTRSRNKEKVKEKEKDSAPAAPPLDKERQKDGRKGLYSGDCVRPSPGAVPSSKARQLHR